MPLAKGAFLCGLLFGACHAGIGYKVLKPFIKRQPKLMTTNASVPLYEEAVSTVFGDKIGKTQGFALLKA
jgi:hypothetical protein